MIKFFKKHKRRFNAVLLPVFCICSVDAIHDCIKYKGDDDTWVRIISFVVAICVTSCCMTMLRLYFKKD